MTADYVAFHAATRPDAVAIIHNGREISYGAFARDIRKFVGALREFGLMPGASVAINCDDFYFDWLLRLACEELSLVTARFSTLNRPVVLSPLREFDLVLSPSATAAGNPRRHHAATPEWLDGILARADQDEGPLPAKTPDDALSMVYTSGTTGTPKRLLLTRGMFARRVEKLMWFIGFTRASRYLLSVPSTARTHAACIRAGATVVIEDRIPIPEAIASYAITHVTLPPIALKRALDELPNRFAKPAALIVLSFGAAISRALQEEALEKLAADVYDLYGSNEVGFASSRRGMAEFGSVWPGVQIEIVDDRDKPVPHGEIGWLRIKTDCMVPGYIDDREATVRTFKRGWFQTRDLGILHGDNRLQVTGRGDDVLNIGWVKLLPNMLEDRVLQSVATGDVGICSIASPGGIEEICVALSDPRCGDQEILEGMKRAFAGMQIGTFRVVKMDRIPRNANGKIERHVLKDLATKLVRAQ